MTTPTLGELTEDKERLQEIVRDAAKLFGLKREVINGITYIGYTNLFGHRFRKNKYSDHFEELRAFYNVAYPEDQIPEQKIDSPFELT